MYYIYILRCEDGKLYTGITTDVKRRFEEHTQQKGKGAKYTRSHKAESVEAVWTAADRSLASKLEYRIKALPRTKKLALIADNSNFSRFFGEEATDNYKRVELRIENVELRIAVSPDGDGSEISNLKA